MVLGRATRALLAITALTLCSTAVSAAPDNLVLAIGGESDVGYDPLLGWGQYGHPLFQSALLTRDHALVTQPELATAWTLSDDRLAWTITLRSDVRFSDGAPLTAEDVAFTFNAAARAAGSVDMTVFDSAEAVDATTVLIRLKQPWITFVETFYTLGIVPAATYDAGYARNPIGSGPYRLVSWTEGEQLIVERNPHYFGKQPAFEKLTFVFAEEDTAYAAALAGQVDLVSVPAALADRVPGGFRTIVADSVDNRGITFPMLPDEGKVDAEGRKLGNAVTSDPAIRHAINIGIDRALVVDVALLGHGTPASGPADGLPWANPDAAVAYSLEDARRILDEAGWLVGPDGVRVKNGIRAAFPINYRASDSTRQALAMTVAELLLPLGIAATATGANNETIARLRHSEPVLYGWGSHSPMEVYSLYNSGSAGSGSYNVGYYSNPAVDGYFEQAQAAPTLEASYDIWKKAEWDGQTGFGARGDAAWAWLVNLDHIYFADECLDLGPLQVEPHGHGWPITSGILNWSWTCP